MTSPLCVHGRKRSGRQKPVVAPPGSGKEDFAVNYRKSGEDVIVKYGHFRVTVFVYYTPVHSLAIQGHCICKNRTRRIAK